MWNILMTEEDKIYVRDKRSPKPSSKQVSRVMSANKAKNTKPEMLMRAALRAVGLSGYRLHWKKAPGRPDIAYPGKRIAVFVNGCYWHRCPHCNLPLPKSNTEYWKIKFEKNIVRDKRKIELLEANGWKVFTIWECEIKKNPLQCAEAIRTYVNDELEK